MSDFNELTRRHVLCITGLYLLCGVATSAQAQGKAFDDNGGNFAAPVNYATGTTPYAVVAADFNADGKLDLAVGNENSDNISVLIGASGGAFATAVPYAAGDGTQGLAVADFNGDTKLDLVAPNLWSSTVSLLLGTGTGTFGAATDFKVGPNPHQIAIADLNGDTKPDVVTADGSGGVSVLLGNGAGSFGTATNFLAGSNPRDVKVGEFNTDGKLDLVVSNEGGASVSILRGDGKGAFSAPTHFAVGARPQTVSVADFNSDGKADLAVASLDDNEVSVLLGNGDGTFTGGADIALGASGKGATATDIDGDGKQDLVVATGWTTVSIFLGSGAGTFGSGTSFSAGGGVNRVAIAHINTDLKPDLAVVNSSDNDVSILLNDPEPVLNVAPSATVDLAASYTLRKVPIWINRQTPNQYPPAFPFSHVGYADIDRDGDTDFLRTFSNNDARYPVQVMVNNGSGAFTDQTGNRITNSQPGLEVPRKILSGDYNSDGWPDFFVIPHGIDLPPFPGEYPQMFLSNGNGTIRYAAGLESEVDFHHGGASADVDGNGTVDILLGGNPRPFLLLNDGLGNLSKNTFRLPRYADGQLIQFIAAELIDVDADGYIDLVVDGYEPYGRQNAVYWGSSTGLYRNRSMTVLPPVADMGVTLDFAIEDIDGDGRKDLIVNRTGSTNIYQGRTLQILRQTSARQFVDETATRMSMNKTLLPMDFIRAQDINGDGSVDLFIDDRNDIASGEYAWTNNGQGVFAPYFGAVNPEVVTLPPADLALNVLDAAGGSYAPGAGVLVNHKVENIGGTASDAYRLTFYASTDTTITTADASLGFEDFTSLSVGASRSFSNTVVQLPVSLPDGQYYIGAIVSISDANNGNNTKHDPVPITVDSAQPALQINAGLNDAWYYPVTNGQGFFITVFPDIGYVALSWFTYDTVRPAAGVTAKLGEPGHRWLNAVGQYAGNQAVLNISYASGGLFDSSTPVTEITDGTIILSFSDCNNGTVEYDIPSIDQQGSIPIQRIVADNIALCESLSQQATSQQNSPAQKTGGNARLQSGDPAVKVEAASLVNMNAGLNDAWYYPVTNGQGFFINVFPALGYVNLSWFTYDTVRPPENVTANLAEPGHRWLNALGQIAGKQAVMQVSYAKGGLFDSPTPVTEVIDGTITLTFSDCNSGTVEYNITSINRQGTVPIQRVAADNIALCEALNAD